MPMLQRTTTAHRRAGAGHPPWCNADRCRVDVVGEHRSDPIPVRLVGGAHLVGTITSSADRPDQPWIEIRLSLRLTGPTLTDKRRHGRAILADLATIAAGHTTTP